ncbi:DoxX family protein [[Mycobacterium] crassicus]|uniref:DoxX family protein n=1 Tax=[Mycobacterium] crassicus TaxID=2872309 RepID=A0ABU5XGV6_9MYCO|nr:DoxX family protein [Mycolicibacter sp. MYC098]MEB3021530.1 DoxX family protein [Mycolicibacter sp. MYC098]
MSPAYLTVTLVAIALNGFSGVAALLRFAPILPGMQAARVPESWLRFPIGTCKTLGALGLVAGLWFPVIGVAASAGLVLFFACAMYTHVLAHDISAQFGLATGFLALNCAVFALSVQRLVASV